VTSKTKQSEQREVEELQSLIDRLPSFGPLARYLKAQGIDPKGKDARRLSAYALAYLCLGLKKLPRAKPSKCKWTEAYDLALQDEVIRLHWQEGLSERKAIEKIAATQRFPYVPRAGRRYPKSDPKRQREAALRKRWTDYRKHQKLLEGEARKLGAVGIWALAVGVPPGEILSAFRPFQVTRSEMHTASNGFESDAR
jgi:hypothetical protein